MFSILTACHNASPFLKDCVDSVLSQSYEDWEWIFVDDASTDNSMEYIESIKDPRIIKFRNSERLYCSESYRFALSKAKGDVCGILDADDALHPAALQSVLFRYRQCPHLGFIYTQHYWCDEKLRVVKSGISSCPKGGSLVDLSLRRKHCFSHFRTFKRYIAEKTEIFPMGLKVAVDKNMGFALEEVAYGGFLSMKLYYYRYHKKNMSLTQAGEQKSVWAELVKSRQKNRRKKGIRVYPIQELS